MSTGAPITILYFAAARTVLGISSESLTLPADAPSLPLSKLPELLAQRHPQHADELRRVLAGSKWSVDQTMVDQDEVDGVTLTPGQEVAVIPPGESSTAAVNVRPVEKELKVKPAPSPSKLRAYASSRTTETTPLLPTTLAYTPAPAGTESNLLILFHGLGDTSRPFATLGQSLQRSLPQTAILSVQASRQVPFLDPGEEAWMWWDTFDGLGEILTKPNPTATVLGIRLLLDYLTASEDEGGCGWPPFSLHLFGFGQGASAALEAAVAFARARRSRLRAADEDAPPPNSKITEVGSVVGVCGGFISHPTLNPVLGTPILYLHRSPREPSWAIASLRKATRALTVAKLDPLTAPGGEVVTEAMPRNQREWDVVMQFWAKILRNRIRWEVDGDVHVLA